MSVKGRVAIVTGAGGGLGREYALALAAAGAKVVINDYGGSLEGKAGEISRAQSVVDEIKAAGGEAIADGHDVSVKSQSLAIVAATIKAFGTVDILVNNAGISGKPSSHDDIDPDAFLRVLEIAVVGSALMTSACYPTMQKKNHGRVINISSDGIYGFGAGGDCAYSASKGATFALTKELGRYSDRHGILINCVMPSGWSRMGDLAESTKKVTRTYFDPAKVAPFIVALSSDECKVSGEVFACGAGRASRTTLATFPGSNQSTADAWLKDWETVMGNPEKVYLPTSTVDHVKYGIKNATGEEMEHIADFGIAST